MARLSRNLVPGLVQHFIQLGNNRQAIFFADGDYRLYFDSLQLAAERYDCAIHAYVLITNHVHLLVTPASAHGLSRLMQSVGGDMCAMSIQYTGARERFGGEVQVRPGRVGARYLLTCMSYIELNPVRAGMVEKPGVS